MLVKLALFVSFVVGRPSKSPPLHGSLHGSPRPPPPRKLEIAGGSNSVLIVGAGLSGLSAAQALLASSLKFSVTVLEGNNRAGGRVNTMQTAAGFPIEIGGEGLG